MTIEQAKQIRLEDFLQSLGYTPIRQRGNKLWYHSPLHSENTSSFKVNTDRNQWYDFGIGRGGSIIDFAMLYYHTTDISQVLKPIMPLHLLVEFACHLYESYSFGRSGKGA